MDTGFDFHSLFENWNDAHEAEFIEFLQKIECPENFRGLFHVANYLGLIADLHPKSFEQVFGVRSSIFQDFLGIKESAWDVFAMRSLQRGSKSTRPTYALLFTLSESNDQEIYSTVLSFINHFFNNESTIKSHGREEQSMRALRLLVTDPETELNQLHAASPIQTANQILHYRKSLLDEFGQLVSRTIVGYLRELEHFYRLDWKERTSISRSSREKIRASYSRRKIERISGTDDLYTLALNQIKINQFNLVNGLDAKEDLPPLAIVKQFPEIASKPKHELPDVSIVKDKIKARWQKQAVERHLAKSHNLTSTSRSLLQPHELYYLLESLKPRQKSSLQVWSTQSVLLLSLLFGMGIKQMKSLRRIGVASNDGCGFFESNGNWYYKVKHDPTAQMGKHKRNSHLLPVKPYAIIPMPSLLVTYLGLDGIDVGDYVLELSSEAQELIHVQAFLKKLNKKHHCQISFKSISFYLNNKILASINHDPTVLESLSGESNYYNRSMRHYLWLSDEENTARIYELWNTIRADAKLFAKSCFLPEFKLPGFSRSETEYHKEGVGSQFTPTRTAIQSLVKHLKSETDVPSAFDASYNLEATVKYHNAYTLYTVYMLLNATGYRAVHNPLPSISLHLLRYNAVCISDKDSYNSFAHSRIIAIPAVLKQQLQHYKEHLNALGNLLAGTRVAEAKAMHWHIAEKVHLEKSSKVERIDWFLGAKHSRSNDGVFNYLKADSTDSKNVHPKQIVASTPESLRLPINFGRHYLRRYLIKQGAAIELINAQLGHWVSGELPLSHLSTFEHCQAITELNEFLNPMMDELGWEPLPSVLTRKRL